MCGIKFKQVRIVLVLLFVWILGYFMGSILQSYPLPMARLNFISVNGIIGSSIIRDRANLSSTRECDFPVLNPLDVTIKKYIKKYPPLNCSAFIPSIAHIVGDDIVISPDKVKKKLKGLSVDFCKYRNITMKPGNDFKVNFGIWSKEFNSSIRLREREENLQVDCFQKKNVISRSYLVRIKKKPEVEKKRVEDYQKHVNKHSPKETLSVLFVGIDGTSKQNLIRTMPKTRKFVLDKLHAIEFHKYNKVGLNTFPNVMPLLSCLHVEEVKNWTFKEHFDKIDHLFLWNKFQKAGYRTSLLMDYITVTPFHYLKKGWANPPFDFYPRAITVASEPDKKVFRRENNNCMGDTPEVTLFNDYRLQLTTAYNNTPSTPYFIFSFLARLTHDDQNKASAGDELYLTLFQELHKRNVLNNTLLVFFSDHGERFGDIRHTYNGLMEAKMPFLFFIFPAWFEKKYPKVMKTFRINTNRLMTTFDLHATLKDVLYFNGKSRQYSPLDRSISLFSEIPTNRTCEMAGIPVKYCLCTRISHENIASTDLQKDMSQKFLDHVVSLTKKHRDKCTTLSLKEIQNTFSVQPEFPLKVKNASLYYITIKTSPNNAIYESTVMYKATDKSVTVYGDVSRLNMYRGQAECIDDAKLRPFCFCKK